MSITRRQVLAAAGAAAVFPGVAKSEPATVAAAATFASLAIEMMKESGSEQKRWEAGFLLWHEIAVGQRVLLGAIGKVDYHLKDVMNLIKQVPGETVALEYLSKIINRQRDITAFLNAEGQEYKSARAAFLSQAKDIYGTASSTTVPRVAVAAARALAGINAIVSIERLEEPARVSLVKEAIDSVEFACLNLLMPSSTLSESINQFDAKIAEARTALAADPLYAVLIPKLPNTAPSAESGAVRVGNQERCWMMRLPDVSGGDQAIEEGRWIKVRIGTRTPYRRPTFHTRFPIEVFARPVYGGDVFFELFHRPLKEWRSSVWNQHDEHIVLRDPATQNRVGDRTVTVGTDDPGIIANCIATGFSAEQYPVRLAAFNSKLKDAADLIARKSVLLGLRDLTRANFRRCRQLKLMATE